VVLLGLAAAFVGYLIWQFSEALGLPFGAGASIVGWTFAAALGLAVIHFSGGLGLFSVESTWPVALGVVFMGFWPAIKFWGDRTPPAFGRAEVVELTWWAEWYTLWPALIVLVVGGYMLNTYRDRRF